MNLDDSLRDRTHCLHADGLVVDEGPGASVGKLQAAQNEIAIDRDILRGGDAAGRMLGRKVENRGHLTLRLACAHERPVASAAERQGESIKQDRFAGAGLAGQHGEASPKGEIEAIDQNDVADRELD